MTMLIPAGCRQLDKNEKIIKGDKFWAGGQWQLSNNYMDGHQATYFTYIYIRQIQLETPMLDLNKPVQLRNGTPATIIARDMCCGKRDDDFVIVYKENGSDIVRRCFGNGIKSDGSRDYDVINVPPEKKKTKVFINVYKDGQCVGHPTKSSAEIFSKGSGNKVIAYFEKEIEYTEGEGLENEED